jgi:hypothetical protein
MKMPMTAPVLRPAHHAGAKAHLTHALFVALDLNAETIIGLHEPYFMNYSFWHFANLLCH